VPKGALWVNTRNRSRECSTEEEVGSARRYKKLD
jgi:hypothetical protein